MSIKLRGIELNSFRAFEGERIFNFVNENFDEISNLVILYAPNGTGKTTFFDAIEWSMSGEIKRISNNKNVLDIAKQERSYILKNKYSDSCVGTVELQFEDDTLLKVETRKLNRSRTIDYHSGVQINKTVNLTKEELDKAVETNLLTHDQIDAFLRSQNSEQRYNALSVFWDKENQSEDYKNLVFMVSEIDKIVENYNKEIYKLNEEIIKVEINPRIWQEINHLKEAYVSVSGEKDSLSNNGLSLQKLYIESTKLKIENENVISNNMIEISNIKKFRKTIQDEYVKIPEKLINLVKQKAIQKEFIVIFTKIERNEEKKNQLLKEKLKINEYIRRCKFVIEYNPIFTDQEKEKIEAKSKSEKLIKERKKTEAVLITTQVEIQEQKSELKIKKSEKDMLIKDIENINSLKKYPIFITQINELNKEKKDMWKKEMTIRKELEIMNLKVSKLLKVHILDKKEFIQKDYSNDGDFSFIFEKSQMIIKNSKSIDITKQVLEEKKKELSSLEKLGSNLEQLRKLGYSIVASAETAICPLCSNDYKEFEKLINKINNNTVDLLRITSVNEEIRNLEETLITLNTELDTKLAEAKQLIQNEIKKNEIEINILNEQNIRLTTEIKHKEKECLECEIQINKLLEYKKKFDISLENLENQICGKEITIKAELSKMEIKYDDLESKKDEKEKLKIQIENNLENIDLKSQQTKKRIADIRDNDQYVLYQQEIKYFESIDVTNTMDFKKQNESNLEKIKVKEKKLKSDDEKLLDKVVGQSKIESINKIRVCENEILLFEERKKSIEQKSLDLLGEVVDETYDFKIPEKKLDENNSKLKKKNEILIQIAGISSGFIDETKVEVKKSELNKLKEVYSVLNSKSRELTKLKADKLSFIKNKIESTFNLDIVNKIFQMIEPHPDFREISFKIDESNSDKLGLDIICKRRNEEKEAPILYLSSAQINILSLSIFLGTALENTDKLNTIFMDDPIQHLDSLNELSFIDLLRIISFQLGKQIIFSTHSQQFFNLCKRKLDDKHHNSSFIEINSLNSELG